VIEGKRASCSPMLADCLPESRAECVLPAYPPQPFGLLVYLVVAIARSR
jgi:hypothetical protein